MFSLRRWRPWHLLLAWCTYWIALFAFALGRPALAIWRISQGPDGHGTVSAGFDNAVAHLTVVQDAVTVWSGRAHLATLALWIAGPPLLLWWQWLRRTRPRPAAHERAGPAAR